MYADTERALFAAATRALLAAGWKRPAAAQWPVADAGRYVLIDEHECRALGYRATYPYRVFVDYIWYGQRDEQLLDARVDDVQQAVDLLTTLDVLPQADVLVTLAGPVT